MQWSATGRRRWRRSERESFDLVLMDVQMPEMGGLEATAEIRRREAGTGRRVPIVALTARAMKGDRERCLEAGMDDYITKPLRTRELFEILDRLTAPGKPAERPRRRRPRRHIAPVVDRAALLERFDGSEELLRQVADVFLQTCPEMLGAVDAAIASRDATRLRDAAHSLKGAIANFATADAHAAAFRLERMGAENDLREAAPALVVLQVSVARLKDELLAAGGGEHMI